MNDKLYNLMNWPEIEAIVYSECENPKDILGAHKTQKGILIQAFLPFAKEVYVVTYDKKLKQKMDMVDDDGFFATLIASKSMIKYYFLVVDKNGKEEQIYDPYSFEVDIKENNLRAFLQGDETEAYDIFGAHEVALDGVRGVRFTIWLPRVVRVSVVGDFNNWDGRIHQMQRIKGTDVYSIFIPQAKVGDLYKYEIKQRGGIVTLKSDPYTYESELMPSDASIICNTNDYKWKDKKWILDRRNFDIDSSPLNIYELNIGYFKFDENGNHKNYKDIAKDVCDYVKDMGYTHIELMPIMEYINDDSLGYQTARYYAPTKRYGTPQDFMYFVDYMHQNQIGVILDFVPAYFAEDASSLMQINGEPLYEYTREELAKYPGLDALIFDYGRTEVRNFLISAANFWVDKYHLDGIRINSVSSMLYRDYARMPGHWIANMYGGKENLEAEYLLKKINELIPKNNQGVMVIAEELSSWPKVTEKSKDGGLGFSYKWNSGWVSDFLSYMSCDPLFRKCRYNDLTVGMLYAYSERYILALSHNDVTSNRGSVLGKMPGDMAHKMANMRVAYGYMYTHPGKKLMFMGQDIAEMAEWNIKRDIQWDLLTYKDSSCMKQYVKDLNLMYKTEEALYKWDYNIEGFEWINDFSSKESIIVFERKSSDNDRLIVVANFDDVMYQGYNIGVIKYGKYKEIFNSDATIYGGTGVVNKRKKTARCEECDGRDYSLRVDIPPLGMLVLKYEEIEVEKNDRVD